MAGDDPLRNPEQLMRRVYAYVAYRVGDPGEAEDITSETFERALRYRGSFDPRKGDAVGWLLGIARNCLYDRQLRPREQALVQEQPAAGDLEAEVIERLTLNQALAALSVNDRELLALRYGADLRAREIAHLLDQRTNAVEVALSRARARLAAELEKSSRPPGRVGLPELAPDLADGVQ